MQSTTPPPTTDPLVNLILAESHDAGPFPTTGGIIHKLSLDQATTLAKRLREEVVKTGVDLPLATAWLRGESDFDDRAENPNNQNGKPGDTPYQVFLRTDIGLGQFDGQFLEEYPGMAGLHWQDQKAKALTLEWALPTFMQTVKDLVDWGILACKNDAKVLEGANGNPLLLSCEAYNIGRTGAKGLAYLCYNLIEAKKVGYPPKIADARKALGNRGWDYAQGILKRYEDHKKRLAPIPPKP